MSVVNTIVKTDTEKIVLMVPPSSTHYIVPPVGLGYLAAALRRKGFSDLAILDCLKENMAHKDLSSFFKEWKPRVVGIQIFYYDC